MNDKDITKLASKLTQSLAMKDDIARLERKIDRVDEKADTILKFAESVDEITTTHGKRLDRIEAIPIVAHQLKLKK